MVNPYREPGMERYWVPSNLASAVFGTDIADYWFPVSTGGDIAFLSGVLKILIEQGWVDESFIRNHTSGFEELSTQLSTLDSRLSALLVVTLAYMVVLFILSSVPGSGEGGRLMDLVSPTVANIAHVPAYGLLALLWILTLRDYGVSEHRSMWVAFLVASGYGALTELYQFWVPGRFPSVLDVMSNIAGSLLFIWLYWWASRKLRVENRERMVEGH